MPLERDKKGGGEWGWHAAKGPGLESNVGHCGADTAFIHVPQVSYFCTLKRCCIIICKIIYKLLQDSSLHPNRVVIREDYWYSWWQKLDWGWGLKTLNAYGNKLCLGCCNQPMEFLVVPDAPSAGRHHLCVPFKIIHKHLITWSILLSCLGFAQKCID